HIPAAVVEQLRVFRRPDQMPSQRPRLEAAALVEFAKMRNRLLNNPPPHPNTAHQTPITVDLPILLACRVAQIHAPNRIRGAAFEKYPWSPLHAKIALSPLSTTQPFDPTQPVRQIGSPKQPQVAQVGLKYQLAPLGGSVQIERIRPRPPPHEKLN